MYDFFICFKSVDCWVKKLGDILIFENNMDLAETVEAHTDPFAFGVAEC